MKFPSAAAALLLFTAVPLFAAPPVAVGDSFTSAEDTPIIRTAAAGLNANDTFGTALDPATGLITSPAHGTLTLSPNGAFTYTPAANYSGPDSFSYKVFGDRPVTAFTIDEANSTLTIGATLRLTFQGVPSVSNDSTTSRVKGTLAAAIAPETAPFSVVRVTDFDSVLSQAIQLKLGVGCIPIINTCLGGVQFDAPADAITLNMDAAGPATIVRANGGFDTDGSTFSVAGDGTVKGTEQLATVLPETPLPLTLPAIAMPFNGKLSISGGNVRLEMQINFRGSIAVDATTNLSFSISGTIRALAPLPLASVEASAPAAVDLTITPVNDAPVAAADSYLVRAGTALAVTATGTQTAQQIIAAGATWKYEHTGADLGTGWRTWGFNDTAWSAGPAELGYGDSGIFGGNRPEATNIRGAGPARTTAYFRKEFTLTDVNSTRGLTLELLRDDGAAVYLNGFAVSRQNLAANATYTTTADSRIPNAAETQFFSATVPPELLLEGRNVVAVEVHQFSTADLFTIQQIDPADVSFDFKLARQTGLTGVLANDTDIDSASLTVLPHVPPAHGQVTLQTDGAFTYTPDAGFTGTDSFVYRVSDGGTELSELRLIPAGAVWKYLDDGSNQTLPGVRRVLRRRLVKRGGGNRLWRRQHARTTGRRTTKLTYLLTSPPVTTYFRKSFALPVPKTMIQSLKLRLLRDDGAAVYLNGVEIARDNLTANAGFEDGAILPVEGEAEAAWNEHTVSPPDSPPLWTALTFSPWNCTKISMSATTPVSTLN